MIASNFNISGTLTLVAFSQIRSLFIQLIAMEVERDGNERSIRNCVLIESNSQFFTVIKRSITEQELAAKNKAIELSKYIQEKGLKLNYENFAQLFVQTSYMIFSCRHYNFTPEITTSDVRVEESLFRFNQKRFYPIIFYRLLDDKVMEPFSGIQILRDLYKYFFDFYTKYEEYFRNEMNQMDLDFKNAIIKFEIQFRYLMDNMQTLEQTKDKEKQIFLCLEETDLFKDSSLLLKIKNCSVMDLIKTSADKYTHFKSAKEIDVKLVTEYNNQRKKTKDHQVLKNKEKDIENNLINFFKGLNPKESQMEQTVSDAEKEQSYKVRFSYKIRQKTEYNFNTAIRKIIKQLPEPIAEQANEKKKGRPEIEFYIEYSSDRNSICIRLMTNSINVNVQTSDFLMFESNVFTFDNANVNIQLSDSKQNDKNQPPRKVLTFKGASCFNTKEPPLEKILLLMDITMISSKVYEPQLNPARALFTGIRDYQRLPIISAKVKHYTKMFLKCAKRVYNQ